VITDLQNLLTEQFKEWSDQNAKGYTSVKYQTWVDERAIDKRLLSKSIGWGRGPNAKKVMMTKSAEVETNLTVEVVILPILPGTTEDQPPHTTSNPTEEALPSTPQLAVEDTIMTGETKQSTPVAGTNEEPFPVSTPDLNLNLLDGPLLAAYQPSSKDDLGDTELKFDASSSDESMEGKVEEAIKPSEDSVVATESNTPEGTMTLPSPTETTSLENTINQPTSIRQMPKPINLSVLTGALNPNQTKRESPSHIESSVNPAGL
jgi:hypothetical protein